MNYFEGETFNSAKILEEKSNLTNEEINAKYKRGEIRIVTEQARYPINSIITMLDSGNYKRNPEYQRRKRWNIEKKSRLIESFIMNVPLPPIFLYEYEYSKYEVMDGLQRLTAIDDFYRNKFALTGLEYWIELNGKKYEELPSEIQAGIDRRYLSSIVLLEETAKTEEEAEKLKQIVFERLNSGGEKINPQESRNALHNGKFNQLCINLAKNKKFRIMWEISDEDDEEKLLESKLYREMGDVQLVLRFFAYRFIDNMGSVIENFLDEYLNQANKFSDKTINDLENLFNETIELVYDIFGFEAFLMPNYDRKVKSPQKTIYDPLMQSMSNFVIHKNELLKKAEIIRNNKYSENLYIDEEKDLRIFNGRDNLPSSVKNRTEYFNRLLTNYIY